MVSLNFNLSNKLFYTLIVIVAVLIAGGIVIAWNSNNPQTHGHTANEISGLPSGAGATCRVIEQGFGTGSSAAQGSVSCNDDEVLTGGACRDNGSGRDIVTASIGTQIVGRNYTCKADQSIRISVVCCKGTLS